MKTKAEFLKQWQERYEAELEYFSDKTEAITSEEREKSIATINYVNEIIDTILEEFYKIEEFIDAGPVKRTIIDTTELLKGYEFHEGFVKDDENALVKYIDEETYFLLTDEGTNELFFAFETRKHDFYYEIMSFGYFDRQLFQSEMKTDKEIEEMQLRMLHQDFTSPIEELQPELDF